MLEGRKGYCLSLITRTSPQGCGVACFVVYPVSSVHFLTTRLQRPWAAKKPLAGALTPCTDDDDAEEWGVDFFPLTSSSLP